MKVYFRYFRSRTMHQRVLVVLLYIFLNTEKYRFFSVLGTGINTEIPKKDSV